MTKRLLWLACALAAVTIYALIVSPREAEIASARNHAALLYDGARTNEEHIAAAARLKDVQSRVVADVRTLAGQHDASAMTAVTLRLLSSEGSRFNVRVTSIAPDAAHPESNADPLLGAPATLGLTGHFRDIVAFLADVSRHDVLIAINDVSLGAATDAPGSGSPVLNVVAHTTFYRIRPTALTEIDHAQAN